MVNVKWASSQQNLSSGFLTKRDSHQPPQLQRLARKLKFRWWQEHIIFSYKRISKALISLCGCAGWSAPLLFAKHRRQVFSRRGPNYVFYFLLNASTPKRPIITRNHALAQTEQISSVTRKHFRGARFLIELVGQCRSGSYNQFTVFFFFYFIFFSPVQGYRVGNCDTFYLSSYIILTKKKLSI